MTESEAGERLRVIVLLEGYQAFSGLRSLDEPGLRLQIQGSVARLQDDFLKRLGPGPGREVRRLENLPILSLTVSRQELEALKGMEGVAHIQEDRRLVLHTAQGVPLIQPGLFRDRFGGAGVAVAVVDTGVDYTHPALRGIVAPPGGDPGGDQGGDQGGGQPGEGGVMSQLSAFPNGKVLGGYDLGENDPDPMDKLGHGTSTAGLAVGADTAVGDYIGGVAPRAGLYALKVANAEGTIFEAYYLAALDWCLSHQLDHPDQPLLIVSASLGTPDAQFNSSCDQRYPAASALVDSLVANGIAVFVSSGNEGSCAGVSGPACLSRTIAVGAVYDAVLGAQPSSDLAFCIDSASCIGTPAGGCPYGASCQDLFPVPDEVPCFSNSGLTLDLLAPSACAFTPGLNGGYRDCFSGTSAACPYAAGAGAVVQSAAKAVLGRFLSPDELRLVLAENGDPVLDLKSGLTTPRVNLARTVNALGAMFGTGR